MFISDFSIRRPVITVVLMVALVVFGLFSLFSLQTDEFPDITNPIVFVAVPYPGAAPEQVEREIVDRMEEAFGSISGIDQITSRSLDGFATITVQFLFGKDPDQAMQDVRDAISAIQNDLPTDMKPPILQKFDPDQLPIVSLVLRSPGLAPADLTSLADPGLTRQLRAIPGVAQVTVSGGVPREIAVDLRPRDLRANQVSVSQVVQALQSQNLATPVGATQGTLEERTIRLEGRIENPAEFGDVPVATRNGQAIRLRDVATVRDTANEARSLALFNGVEAVGLDVVKSKGASTATVSKAVMRALPALQKLLPPGTTLASVRDAGERVTRSVADVEHALFAGAILTVLVVFLFLNSWRSTVITGLALPVSTIAAFIAVALFGFTLNTMSLLGLSLAIGILIDDAIVVRENIVRHVEMGEDHVLASHKATDEIGLAVTATTFSIVAVFAPVAFMSGISGQWFKPFALTIACAVLVSLFVSFSLDPMLSAYWPDPQIEQHRRTNRVARAIGRWNRWFDRQADRYRDVIGWALDHRWWMVGLAAGAFVVALVVQGVFGRFGFAPNSDRSELNLSIETPPGSSLQFTRTKTDQVLAILRRHPEVASTYATLGSAASGGLGATGSGDVTTASVYVKLVPKSKRHVSQARFGAALRSQLARIGGATASVFTGGFGGNMKEIQVQVQSRVQSDMDQAAQTIMDAIRPIPGVADVALSTKGQKTEIQVSLRRGLIASMGLSVGQVAQSLLPAFAGLKTGDWVDPSGKTRDVTVRLAADARRNAADLVQVPIVVAPAATAAPAATFASAASPPTPGIVPAVGAASGAAPIVPLGQIAEVRSGYGPAAIEHLDQERVVRVEANSQGRSLGQVSRDVIATIGKLRLPPSVHVSQGGQVKDQNEVFGRIAAALGIAILLMYLILVVQFGSFVDPLAILVSLPLSLIGVVIALLVTGDSLNIMSLIGVILLMGIVAKNAILLIDFAKWRHAEGTPLREALIEAGRVRLRPIIMTTMALIAGMIPVALGIGEGADFRAPLGRAVIGGVITSTVLTLLVIPTVYEIFTEWRVALAARFRRALHREGGETPPAGAVPATAPKRRH